MKDPNFIERRKEYRLPYHQKVIFTDGTQSFTAYAVNISRGGIFATSLDPLPIDTQIHMAFMIPNQPKAFCVKGRVAHIVFDRQRCEVECGMGLMFMELNESQKSILNLHILNEQSIYQDLKRLLAEENPNAAEVQKRLKHMPYLQQYDLLGLRYKVNRICTIFEPPPSAVAGDSRPIKAAS